MEWGGVEWSGLNPNLESALTPSLSWSFRWSWSRALQYVIISLYYSKLYSTMLLLRYTTVQCTVLCCDCSWVLFVYISQVGDGLRQLDPPWPVMENTVSKSVLNKVTNLQISTTGWPSISSWEVVTDRDTISGSDCKHSPSSFWVWWSVTGIFV